ncbi:3365_t:CDS:1, partial [Paraglomus occultum]
MHTQYFTIIILAILFIHSVSSCEVDTDCPVGFVCSTTPSTQGQCVYGCHTDGNCRIDAANTRNLTCDKNLPRWSCTCDNKSDCDGNGTCANGHCVLPINFGEKGLFSLCNLSALESAFDDVCAWLLNGEYTSLSYDAAVAACDTVTDGLGALFCSSLVSYLFHLIAEYGGLNGAISD